MIYCTAFTIVALVLFMGNTIFGLSPGVGVYLKMLTSTGFLAMAIAAGGLHSGYGQMILVALFFSWWGDLFLISGSEKIFLAGLIVFFIGHLGFAGAFLIHGVDWKWFGISAALCLIPLVIILGWLNSHLGSMRIPVYAYIVIISIMVALAAGAWGRGATTLVIVGAIIFYVSDIFVARDRFVTPSPWNGYLGLPLYYIAQMLLAASILGVNEPQG